MKDIIGTIISQKGKEQDRDRVLRLVLKFPSALVKLGILAVKKIADLKKLQRKKSPETVFFFVTNKCNQKCIHCFYSSELNTPTDGMTLESIRKLCNSIAGRVPTVFLCGGEPTTRPDLAEVVKLFIETARVSRLFITSNGLLQQKLLDAVDAALSSKRRFQLRIPISLDGPEAIHDTIRRHPGGFQKAVATLQELMKRSQKDSRLIPLTTTVIQKENAAVFVDFYKYLRTTLGCQAQFTFIRQDHRDVGGLDKSMLLDAGNAQDLLPPVEVCRKILDEVCEFEKSRQSSYMPLLGASFLEHHLAIVESHCPGASPCVAPDTFATIYPDGGVSLCEVVKPFADLKDFNYDLIACWNSAASDDQRKKLSSCWCTYPCALCNSIMRNPQALIRSLQWVKHNLQKK